MDIEEYEYKLPPNFEIIKPIIQSYFNIHRIIVGPLKRSFDHLFSVWRTAIRMGEPYNTNPSINSMLTKAIQMYEYFSWLVEDNLRLIEKFKLSNPYDFEFINPYVRNEMFKKDMHAYRFYEDEVYRITEYLSNHGFLMNTNINVVELARKM